MEQNTLERSVEKYLVRYVKACKGKSYKWVSPGNNGVPDRIVFINKQIWFIELKRPEGGVTSGLQQIVRRLIVSHGGRYANLKSKKEVDRWIGCIFTTTK